LEMCETKDKRILIPYLMNDAVECYLAFSGASLRGPLDPTRGWDDGPVDTVPETRALMDTFTEQIYQEEILTDNIQLVSHQDHYGMVIHQLSGNVATLWYKQMSLEVNCYQYHLIGHRWRREPGEEYIRRLVNLICVLHDKRTYLGDVYCCDIELLLSNLAEFPPVLFYTPINESILGWYPESAEGIETALYLAKRCQDSELVRLILSYENAFAKGKNLRRVMEKVTGALGEPEHFPLWQLVFELMTKACEELPGRDYGPEKNGIVRAKREALVSEYRAKEYVGDFPYMTKTVLADSGEVNQVEKLTFPKEVYFFEEQPFTLLEEEDYEYQVFALEL
ncbi:MAG: DUF3878 family protein, partial [Dorea sp.]|nr:DUF3878 family protein [Dorea sp.]